MVKRTSEDIQREINQLKNRKKEVLAQEKSKARKLRTKRLIERGAILEQFIEDAESYTNDEVQEIVKYALNVVEEIEKAKNAQLAREIEVAIPKEISLTGT